MDYYFNLWAETNNKLQYSLCFILFEKLDNINIATVKHADD